MTAVIVLLAVVLVLVCWVVGAYNRLARLRKRFKTAFAQIDAQWQRRHGLIPKLVETAGDYMQHELEALEAVSAARNQAVAANAKADPTDAAVVQQMAAAEGALTSSLGRMLALSQAYPDLEADRNMMQLAEELSGTENRIAFARQAYNDSVTQYNASLAQFPGSVIANMFAFKRAALLQLAEMPEQRKAAKLSP
jgi:LemA protein